MQRRCFKCLWFWIGQLSVLRGLLDAVKSLQSNTVSIPVSLSSPLLWIYWHTHYGLFSANYYTISIHNKGAGIPQSVNWLRCGMKDPGFDSWQEKKNSLFQNVQTASGVQLAAYSVGTGVFSTWSIGQGVKLNTRLHLVTRLGVSGAVRLLPLHAFMVWTGTTVLLPFHQS
jgi:hypothetical protein